MKPINALIRKAKNQENIVTGENDVFFFWLERGVCRTNRLIVNVLTKTRAVSLLDNGFELYSFFSFENVLEISIFFYNNYPILLQTVLANGQDYKLSIFVFVSNVIGTCTLSVVYLSVGFREKSH